MKSIIVMALVVLVTGCAGNKASLNDFPNPCAEGKLSGRGISPLNGDLQESIRQARQEAIADLLERNRDLLVTVVTDYRRDVSVKGSSMEITQELKRRIKARTYPMVLKGKRFYEKAVASDVVAWVCMDRDEFEKGLSEALRLRKKRVKQAERYYHEALQLKKSDLDTAITVFQEAKNTLVEVGAEKELYRKPDGKLAVLYEDIENEIGHAVERKEHEYIEEKKRELERQRREKEKNRLLKPISGNKAVDTVFYGMAGFTVGYGLLVLGIMVAGMAAML